MELGRLQALAAQLGESPAHVARTLRDELDTALAELDAGLAAGDAEVVARACHAARNSVLMLDEPAMLSTLRAIEADAHAPPAAERDALGTEWARVRRELSAPVG